MPNITCCLLEVVDRSRIGGVAGLVVATIPTATIPLGVTTCDLCPCACGPQLPAHEVVCPHPAPPFPKHTILPCFCDVAMMRLSSHACDSTFWLVHAEAWVQCINNLLLLVLHSNHLPTHV